MSITGNRSELLFPGPTIALTESNSTNNYYFTGQLELGLEPRVSHLQLLCSVRAFTLVCVGAVGDLGPGQASVVLRVAVYMGGTPCSVVDSRVDLRESDGGSRE